MLVTDCSAPSIQYITGDGVPLARQSSKPPVELENFRECEGFNTNLGTFPAPLLFADNSSLK